MPDGCGCVAMDASVVDNQSNDAHSRGMVLFFRERPPSAIAGRRGGRIAQVESEGTRPALLPAGPVPERWNVKSVIIETTDGPAIGWTGLFGFLF